jgi:hypothetical protein
MSRTWMAAMVMGATMLLACADDLAVNEPASDEEQAAELDQAVPDEAASGQDVQIAVRRDAIIFGDDAPGPVGCKVDCMSVCNQDGQHHSDCQKSCQKACHGSYVPPISSGGGQNQVCLAGNKAWQAICNVTPPLQAACLFSGGCSGCRKKMDKNC